MGEQMNREQKMVREFHEAFGQVINDNPTIPDNETKLLRVKLIAEELNELMVALGVGFDDGGVYCGMPSDIVEIADALADLLYVVLGTAVSCGIDIEPIFHEVHRSNMTKVGGHKREDGKWIKPDSYEPPNIKALINEQSCEHDFEPTDTEGHSYGCLVCGKVTSVWENLV